MTARYLIRFDDITPEMNWRVWEEVERVLDRHRIKPLMAVVPDNRDASLAVGPPAPDFWDRVRSWQARGWTIGLHGYQHRYETSDGGIIGLNSDSEFAGLSREVQEGKLRAALAKFDAERVRAGVWIAPSHSFDDATLDLLAELGPRRISDGFFLHPHVDRRGLLWVPQQLWRLRKRRRGVWTICYHINRWKESDLAAFAGDVEAFAPAISDFETICAAYAHRKRRVSDVVMQRAYLQYLLTLRRAAIWLRR
jgi:predicted deacetylase